MRRDQWVSDFVHALVELRPHLTFRFAMVIGAARYGQNQKLSPEDAANLYAAEAKG